MTGSELQRTDTGRRYHGRMIHAAAGVHEHAAELLSSRLAVGDVILEIGAGSGALSERLVDMGYVVLATDLEPATEHVIAFDLEHDDPETLIGRGPKPRAIACIETLEHLENPRAGLRAMRSLLDPGGHLVLSTPNVAGGYSRLKYLLLGSPLTFGAEHYSGTGHITMLPAWMLRAHLERSGFEIVTMSTAGHTDFRGLKRWAYRMIEAVLRPLTVRDLPKGSSRSGDNMCLFVVARAV